MSTIDNPYSSVSNLGSVQRRTLPLASIGKRLVGFLAEVIIGVGIVIPGFVILLLDPGILREPPELGAMGLFGMLWVFVAAVLFLVIQIYLLITRSQTIGKFIVRTQIVDFETGEPASFVKAGLLRIFVNGLIGVIPFVGTFYAIVDSLFIFRKDRRCIHDFIAGTSVVDMG